MIAQRQLKMAHTVSTTTPSFSFTSTPTPNDLMVAVLAWDSLATLTPPAGWNTLGSKQNITLASTLQVLWRIAQAGDGTSYSTTLSAASSLRQAGYGFSGVNASNPFAGSNFTSQNSANPSVVATPTLPNTYPLAAFFTRSQTTPDFGTAGFQAGWSEDGFDTGLQTQHGPIAGLSAVTASTSFSAADQCVDGIFFLVPAQLVAAAGQWAGYGSWGGEWGS